MTQICVFDLILAHSRKRHFTVSLDHSQLSVFAALERSWQHFGGGTEELLVDRGREMVLDPTVTPVVWNPRFLEPTFRTLGPAQAEFRGGDGLYH